jgi:hypothetical protein
LNQGWTRAGSVFNTGVACVSDGADGVPGLDAGSVGVRVRGAEVAGVEDGDGEVERGGAGVHAAVQREVRPQLDEEQGVLELSFVGPGGGAGEAGRGQAMACLVEPAAVECVLEGRERV